MSNNQLNIRQEPASETSISQHPIGIFDSGYGGLTILKEIVKVLPEYDFTLSRDNARSPYGTRSFDTIYAYTLQAVKYLFRKDVDWSFWLAAASAKASRNIQQLDLPHLYSK
ncbi:MAG: hypothetical protein R2825_25050 [Saprospiraceae bacterium]